MSKNELRSSGKHRRCDFANGASELYLFHRMFTSILGKSVDNRVGEW